MQKSAAEILEIMDSQYIGYQQMKSLRAKDSFLMLKKLLVSIKLQRSLSRDYMTKRQGGHVFSDYPQWAYTIANKLYDPCCEYGEDGKEGLVNLCEEMLKEFGSDDLYFTQQVAQNNEVDFLAQVARDLLID